MDDNSQKENKENNLYRIYLIGFFLILALPLISTPVLLHPTAWGKAIIFRIIISILIFLFIYQILYKKAGQELSSLKRNLTPLNWRKVFSPFWLLIAFFVILFLATIFSLDPRFSFWGSPLRGDGFLNLGLTIIFALLIFLILKKSDWKKIWDFSILIGILVSIITIFQRFNIFKNTIKSFDGRPPGTIGGSIFLGLYLLLLVFITFSFFLKEKERRKKIFYFLAFLLFIYIIFLTGSRAAYFGLFIGLAYFILSFPKKTKLIFSFKVLFLVLALLGAFGFYYLNTHNLISGRLSIKLAVDDPRFSAWVISAEAIKDHPILGYGPENFSIAFDRYYSPCLPFISKEWGSWYDRAHSFIFEIGVTAGIPALIIYILLFGSLFWHLQKKKDFKDSNFLIIHGIQATFFAYLAANLFSFDVFSTYLIFFLIVAYSLSLIMPEKREIETQSKVFLDQVSESAPEELKPGKPLFLSVLLIILICFIWFGALKPLGINEKINWVDHYIRTDQCQKAIEKMKTDVLPFNSVINSYAKLKYVEVVENCNQKMPGLKRALAPDMISILKEVEKIRPYYTRTFIFLANYTNLSIKDNLKEEVDQYLNRATQLSPGREQIFIERFKTYFILEDYESAHEEILKCTRINPESTYCWWLKALSNLYLNKIEQALKDIKKTEGKEFNLHSESHIAQFIAACEKTKNKECFKELTDIYYIVVLYNRLIPKHRLNLIYISAMGEKNEVLKEQLGGFLKTWPELELELKQALKPSYEYTNQINERIIDQYIKYKKNLIECEKIKIIEKEKKDLCYQKLINIYYQEKAIKPYINNIEKLIEEHGRR